MNWIKKTLRFGEKIKRIIKKRASKEEIANSDWASCCKGPILKRDLEDNLWVCPASMSARSSITARLMETWAHGQEVYDQLGVVRENNDRIRNIVVLGVNTYGWTFANRKLPAPGPMPFLSLTAPSGEIWTYGEEQDDERIAGRAEEFCQVVTQVRNVADTSLSVSGKIAQSWMTQAQCFAGPPQPPPAAGTRRTRTA